MFGKIIGALLLFVALSAGAQQKPIKIIVPFGVGGLTDIANRQFDVSLENELGRKIMVEYKPGAAGLIGLRHISQNKTDEVLITVIDTIALANVILLNDDVTLNDFMYLNQVGRTNSIAIAVSKGSSLRTIEGWRNYRGPPITIGANGLGGAHHFYSWLFTNQLGVERTDVFYKGVNEMSANLIGGHINAMWANLASLEQLEQTGKIDIVAINSPQRIDTIPHVPTFREIGIAMVPAKWIMISNNTTDIATVKLIEAAVTKLLNTPDFVRSLKGIGLVVEPDLIKNSKSSMEQTLRQQSKFVEYVKTLKNKEIK